MAKFRNYPPEHGIRVPAAYLENVVREMLLSVDMDDESATLVAGLLVANDQRSVYSHGTKKLTEYLNQIRAGVVNPRPEVKIERDGGAAAVIDGDGGLGHIACHVGMTMAIEKAKRLGVGSVTTYNHYHFGSAGKWSRMALQHDCIGMSTSSHRFHPNPQGMVSSAAASSPVSFAIPADKQPPIVLDMGGHMVSASEQNMEHSPGAVFKGLGLSAVIVSLGGIFAGIYRPEVKPPASRWESNQGSHLTAWNVAHFADVAAFKAEMDRYIGEARATKPLPGMERAELAGGMEWAWEAEAKQLGIIVSNEQREYLEGHADECGVQVSFAEFEDSRF
ncbi:MAG: Ldh family oxidoreductase [Candidatus Latescibacterota bacterium]|nr:Ldh family oxidoreductase [Candidatus Latescibacterota bacterium]